MDEMERRYEFETLALPPLSMTLVRVDEDAAVDDAPPARSLDLSVDEEVIRKLIEFLLQEA